MIPAAWLLLLPAVATAQEWPSFRGPQATGIADGQNLPTTWDSREGINILWRTRILGLGHSSPAVWGDRLFITSAVTPGKDPYLRVGLYGESPDHPEEYVHRYRVYCLEKKTGKILWERTAHSGVPQLKRHIKSSHANPTPALDGERVIVSFGSEGLFAYDMEGELLWKVDLGFLDAGAFNAPELKWGFGGSPIIHGDKVIVLCDVNNQSFLAAFDKRTGNELWRTLRDEVPTWGTPTVHEADGRSQILVNGWKHIGGYDLETGEELWRMTGGGDVPVPTPVVAHGLVFITNAHGRMNPVYAVRLGAQGDISLAEGKTSNDDVAWSDPRRGAYMSTPIVYGEHLYVGNNRGILTVFEAKTGQQVYRVRLAGGRGAYCASPVAADGRIYFTNEDCQIHVIKAGREYEHLATNSIRGVCLATPAISGSTLFVRTARGLYAVARTDKRVRDEPEAVEQVAEAKEAPAESAGVDLSASAGQLNDPVEILRRADAAARAVDVVKYDLVIETTGGAKERMGSLKATIVGTGYWDGLPLKFVIEGEHLPAGASEARRFTAGSDGNLYYLVDHGAKTAHEELELGVLGSFARPVNFSVVTEFHDPDALSEEIAGTAHELRASRQIGGADCYAVHVVYDSQGYSSEATWYFSKKDFLPRRYHFSYELPDGEKGTFLFILSNLAVEPELDPEVFQLKLPEGYSKTDQPAR